MSLAHLLSKIVLCVFITTMFSDKLLMVILPVKYS